MMEQILELLKEIDDANPVDALYSIKFYNDGSGFIYNGQTEAKRFNTIEEAISRLKDIINEITSLKKQ